VLINVSLYCPYYLYPQIYTPKKSLDIIIAMGYITETMKNYITPYITPHITPNPIVPLDIPISDTKKQRAINYVHKVSLSCCRHEHIEVLDNLLDNLHKKYGYDTWHKAKELIVRT